MPLNLPPPPPPAKKDAPKYLGVPDDYRVDRRIGQSDPAFDFGNILGADGQPVTSRTSSIAPRYFVGDELAPAGMSPEKIATMQKALATAGLIGPKTKFRIGVWDEATRGAYKNLLEFANMNGLDEREALKRYTEAEEFDPDPDGGQKRQPLTTRVTHPDDLRATFETVAKAKLGRKLAPGEVDRFIQAFQGQERAEQTTDYNMAETGGSFTAAPNPQAFLAAKLAKEYGAEVGAHSLSETGSDFFDLLNEVGG